METTPSLPASTNESTDHNGDSCRCRDFTTRRERVIGRQPILKQAGWVAPWIHPDRPTDRGTGGKVQRFTAQALGTHRYDCEERSCGVFFVCACVSSFSRFSQAGREKPNVGEWLELKPAPLPCLRSPPSRSHKPGNRRGVLLYPASCYPVCGCRCVFLRVFFFFYPNSLASKPCWSVKVGPTCLRGADLHSGEQWGG